METPTQKSLAEGTYVLIECKPEEANLFHFNSGTRIVYEFSKGLVKGIGKYLKSILISKTEQLWIRDWAYDSESCIIFKLESTEQIRSVLTYKVLLMPEHFSPENILEYKDGDKLLVERELIATNRDGGTEAYRIKLNAQGYAKLYSTKESQQDLWIKVATECSYIESEGIWHVVDRLKSLYNISKNGYINAKELEKDNLIKKLRSKLKDVHIELKDTMIACDFEENELKEKVEILVEALESAKELIGNFRIKNIVPTQETWELIESALEQAKPQTP